MAAGNGVQVTYEQAMQILGAPVLRKQVVSGVYMKGNKICAHCNKGYGRNEPFPADGKLCGGCRQVYYCNAECQRADWKSCHKRVCAGYAEKREEAKTVSNDGAS